MEEPPQPLPTSPRALIREIFPGRVKRARAYGKLAVSIVADVVGEIDDAFMLGRSPGLEARSQERKLESNRKFAAWAANLCAPQYREQLLAESQPLSSVDEDLDTTH
jgi:hypothetical protein